MIYLKAFLDENLGDDLFVQIVAHRYPNSEFLLFASDEYPVNFGNNVHFTFSKDSYKGLEQKIKLYDNRRKSRLQKKCFPIFFRPDHKEERAIVKHADANIYVIGSGFMEGGKIGIWSKLEEWLYYKRKPYILGCNFGPFFSNQYKNYYERLFAKANDVCFRESYSCDIFPELKNARWESDIVFSYNGYVDEKFGRNNGKYVVISVVNLDKDGAKNQNKEGYYRFILEIAKYFCERKIKVVFVGFCKNQGDDVAIENIVKNIRPEFHKQIEIINYPQNNMFYILGVFKDAEAVFASRYHAGIIGMLYGRKTYFLSYSDKMVNVLKDIDEKIRYININEEINVDVNEFILQYGYEILPARLDEIKKSAERQFLKLDSLLK